MVEAGQGQGLGVAEADEIGLFAGGLFLPFEEAVGGDEAAFGFEGVAKGGFFSDGFGTGVDQAIADSGVFGPRGYQTPTKHFEGTFGRFGRMNHRGHRLGGGDVVAGFERGDIGQLKHLGQGGRGDS